MRKHQLKQCQHKSCRQNTISFSDFCAKHSDTKHVLKKLSLVTKKAKDLFFSDLDITDMKLCDIKFNSLTLYDCELNNMIFKNCTFIVSDFTNINFENVEFQNCAFQEVDWKNCNLSNETIINKCNFNSNTFVSSHFNEVSSFTNSNFISTEFITISFYYIDIFKSIYFKGCKFIKSSWSQINGFEISFIDSVFDDNNIEDSFFINSIFENVENDFNDNNIEDSSYLSMVTEHIINDYCAGSSPKLCDFTNTIFKETALPEYFYIWNNTGEDKIDFYYRIISMIGQEEHANNLWALNACIDRLSEIGVENDEKLISNVISIFKLKLIKYSNLKEYGILGSIIEQYDELPSEYKEHQQLLIDSSNTEVIDHQHSKLLLKVKCDDWTISNIASFQSNLKEVEKLLPNKIPLEISYTKKGSIVQMLLGEADKLIIFATGLSGIALTLSIIAKNIATTKKDLLLKKKLENEIKHQQEICDLDILSKKVDLKNKLLTTDINRLEILEKKKRLKIMKQELFSKNIENLTKLGLECGIDVQEFISNKNGVALLTRISELHQNFPIQEAELTIEPNRKQKV